jgi:uncharacterized membrane protein YgcG
MLRSENVRFQFLTTGCLFLAMAAAEAVAPEVKDKAHFFQDETIRKLDNIARQTARDSGRDFVVETVLSVPVDQKEKVKAMSAAERTRFFSNWCADRAEVTVTHGVYILICKDPAHLALDITKDSQAAFGKEGHDKMLADLLKVFQEKHFDEGILAAAEFARERFAAAKKQ